MAVFVAVSDFSSNYAQIPTPRILIDAEPDGCGVSSTEEEGMVMGVTRRHRDVRAAGARMKRGIRGESSKVCNYLSCIMIVLRGH